MSGPLVIGPGEERREGERRSGADGDVGRRQSADRRRTPAWIPADMLHRVLARLIDLVLFGFFVNIVYPVGVAAGFLFLLIADGLMDGRSPGKRIIGLRVVRVGDEAACGFRESIIRNAPVALVCLFAVIPLIGWALFFTLGLVILLAETYLAASDDQGQRAGDILAGTFVLMPARTAPTAAPFGAPSPPPGEPKPVAPPATTEPSADAGPSEPPASA
ncbi:MAG: hypothetical protein C4523_11345 [Myxococcales bacterium]|nr:MAG: hypothetical protein C4523_11345 [Myxococcales bacterium]